MFGQVFLVLCRNRGPLCHDMAFRLDVVARSRHSFFHVATVFCFSVVTMSRQRFPCRDRDGHNKSSGVAIGLALDRDFMS